MAPSTWSVPAGEARASFHIVVTRGRGMIRDRREMAARGAVKPGATFTFSIPCGLEHATDAAYAAGNP